MRILLTGASGFVGGRALLALGARHDVVPLACSALNPRDETEVLRKVEVAKPDAIVHTSAIADMDYAERHPDAAFDANVRLTALMARAAARMGAKLVSFSSDQVYNGTPAPGPFREDAALSPVNVYGRTKLAAEEAAAREAPDSVSLRATWMYDFPVRGLRARPNLLSLLYLAAATGEPLPFSTRDTRGVTYVRQVADLLESALKLPGGAYNFGSENDVSMYDTALAFLGAMGLARRARDVLLRDDASPERWLSMDCAKLRRYCAGFDDTVSGVQRCLREYGVAGAER